MEAKLPIDRGFAFHFHTPKSYIYDRLKKAREIVKGADWNLFSHNHLQLDVYVHAMHMEMPDGLMILEQVLK